MNQANPTTTGVQTQIDPVALCRELTDHLTAYAIAADNFDDEAFATCEKAERFLAMLDPAVQKAEIDTLEAQMRKSDPDIMAFAEGMLQVMGLQDTPRSDCCGRAIAEINGYPVCPGCGAIC